MKRQAVEGAFHIMLAPGSSQVDVGSRIVNDRKQLL
jgi:hypothetical protein